MDRFAQMIVAAARQAETDSGFDVEPEAERVGASIATGIGGLQAFQDCYDILLDARARSGEPVRDPADHPEHGRRLGLDGARQPRAAGVPVHRLRGFEHGDRRGDGHDPARPRGRGLRRRHRSRHHAGRDRRLQRDAGALTAKRGPEKASRPFDADRSGFVMGEAGGVIVLEELEHARARGAKIYAELLGYGLSSDAAHITEPDPTGAEPGARDDRWRSATRASRRRRSTTSMPTALRRRSATRARRNVIKLALGEENARKTPVSSTKGATGHCLGASGAVEAIFSILAVNKNMLPPTINYETPDPECDLDYIPNEAREADVKVAVSNSFGFGGHNACIVLRELAD